jgi:hypothetical protein
MTWEQILLGFRRGLLVSCDLGGVERINVALVKLGTTITYMSMIMAGAYGRYFWSRQRHS